eukprot:1142556-Amphidinium_carterae.1
MLHGSFAGCYGLSMPLNFVVPDNAKPQAEAVSLLDPLHMLNPSQHHCVNFEGSNCDGCSRNVVKSADGWVLHDPDVSHAQRGIAAVDRHTRPLHPTLLPRLNSCAIMTQSEFPCEF